MSAVKSTSAVIDLFANIQAEAWPDQALQPSLHLSVSMMHYSINHCMWMKPIHAWYT
jgi:hypothetical protein